MLPDYRPSLREIATEVAREVIDLDNWKRIGKNAFGVAVLFAAVPYIIPTVVRGYKERFEESIYSEHRESLISEGIGMTTGILGGFGLFFSGIGAYVTYLKEDHPEYLLIPAVTNVGSLVYEVGRRARGRLMGRTSNSRRLSRIA